MLCAFHHPQEKSRAEPPPKKVRSEEIERARQNARLTVGLTATNTSCNPHRTAADPVAHESGNVWYEAPDKFTFIGYMDQPSNKTRSQVSFQRIFSSQSPKDSAVGMKSSDELGFVPHAKSSQKAANRPKPHQRFCVRDLTWMCVVR